MDREIITEEEDKFLRRLDSRSEYYSSIQFPIMAEDYARAATLIRKLIVMLREERENSDETVYEDV